MMKSRLFLLLWMCCSVLLTACENDEPTPQPPVEGSRTVLAYLASDNSLSSFALADLEEMRLGMEKVSANNVHLLVYIDSNSSPRLIELKNEGGELVENTVKTYENRNSVGVAETLEVFDDVFKNDEYRAESYGLIYWSRGRKINCVMRRFFPSSSVGDRPAPRGCTSTPDERKVTTI